MLRIKHAFGEFCSLHYPGYNKRFVSYLSQGVTPLSYRRYDETTRKWLVHVKRLAQVAAYGLRLFGSIDYSELPDDFQKIIQESLKNTSCWKHTKDSDTSPYSALYVVPSAPKEVIKAAYKALAMKHHPDHGGDGYRFRMIQKAYEELRGKGRV